MKSPTENRSTPCRYLVTGAAGFIASKVCEQLLAAGHTVVGIDNLNDYYDVRLKDYRLSRLLGIKDWQPGTDPKVSSFFASVSQSENRGQTPGGQQPATARPQPSVFGTFTFRRLDIENLPALEALFEEFRFTAVFNLAARAGVRASMENPYVFLSTNTQGTLNLLECQRKHGVKKIVLASTSSLYAGCAMPFTEDLSVNTPLSPYAASKKGAELMAYSYHKLYGLDVTVVRYFTVYGPAGRPDMSIFRFIKWIDEGTPIELFGDGSQSRDFTYVDDIARGTIMAGRLFGGQMTDDGGQIAQLKAEGSKPSGVGPSGFSDELKPGYNIINLGGGRNPISLQVVIAFIEKALGKKAAIAGKPFHVADIKETWADISKADRLLGWKPTVLNEDGFQRTVDWYVANRTWLKDVRL